MCLQNWDPEWDPDHTVAFGGLSDKSDMGTMEGMLNSDILVFQDLGTPSEKIWPGYNDLPAVKKMTFSEYPYNNLRKRFGALLSDQGFDLMNK